MSVYHWFSALISAVCIHLLLAVGLLNLGKNSITPQFETTGQAISESVSVSLSSISLPTAFSSTQKPDQPSIKQPPESTKQTQQTPKKKVSAPPKLKKTAPTNDSSPVVETSEKTPSKLLEQTPSVQANSFINDKSPSTPVQDQNDQNVAKLDSTNHQSPRKTDQKKPPAPSNQQHSQASKEYFNLVVQKLIRYKKYPLSARRKKQQGTVTIEFTVSKSGDIIQKKIKQSSGFSKLDAAVLKMLRRADPLPPIPDSIQQTLSNGNLTLVIPVNFALN